MRLPRRGDIVPMKNIRASIRFQRIPFRRRHPKRIPAERSPNGLPYLDVMVLVLLERLPVGSLVRPICIAKNANVMPHSRVVIAGFGYTGESGAFFWRRTNSLLRSAYQGMKSLKLVQPQRIRAPPEHLPHRQNFLREVFDVELSSPFDFFPDDGPVYTQYLHFAITRVLPASDYKCRIASYWGPESEICVYYGQTSICAVSFCCSVFGLSTTRVPAQIN